MSQTETKNFDKSLKKIFLCSLKMTHNQYLSKALMTLLYKKNILQH